jgi:hypothetical protein
MTPDDLARIAEEVSDLGPREAVEETPAAARVQISDD